MKYYKKLRATQAYESKAGKLKIADEGHGRRVVGQLNNLVAEFMDARIYFRSHAGFYSEFSDLLPKISVTAELSSLLTIFVGWCERVESQRILNSPRRGLETPFQPE